MEQKINFEFLFSLQDPDRLIDWCMKFGLITDTYICPQCGQTMRKSKRSEIQDKYIWRCTTDEVKRSIRKGSWFDNSKLSIHKILLITYMWVLKIESQCIMMDTKLSSRTVSGWKKSCREVCLNECVRENERLGGEGLIVEIDENMFGKKKYKHRSLMGDKWVYGGIERGTDKCFMVVVSERSENVLLDVIREYVRPGTIIISECWRKYNCLEQPEYVNLTVNENYILKDPETKTDLSSITGTWSAVKRQLSLYQAEGELNSYLFEYMWRRKYKNEGPQLMYLFLQAVIKSYPPAKHD